MFQNNNANDFKIYVDKSKKYINITFDYFDFEEGVVLQLAHTGNSSNDINLVGTFKGVKKIYRKELFDSLLPFSNAFSKLFSKSLNTRVKIRLPIYAMARIIGFAGAVMFIYPLIKYYVLPQTQKSVPILNNQKTIIDEIPFIIIGLFYLWAGMRIGKRKVPKDLDIFNEEF